MEKGNNRWVKDSGGLKSVPPFPGECINKRQGRKPMVEKVVERDSFIS